MLFAHERHAPMKKTIIVFLIILVFLPSVSFAGTVYGSLFASHLACGASNKDRMYTHFGDDILSGFGGNDYLSAGRGFDRCYGGAGHDTLIGCNYSYTAADYEGCENGTCSKADTEDGLSCDTVIGTADLLMVFGGPGLDVVLFPVEAGNALQEIQATDTVLIDVGGRQALRAVMTALYSLGPGGAVIEDDHIVPNGDGTYSVSVPVMNMEAAESVAADLFVITKYGSVIMENPYTGKAVYLSKVDYIGFRNAPLIPVATK